MEKFKNYFQKILKVIKNSKLINYFVPKILGIMIGYAIFRIIFPIILK